MKAPQPRVCCYYGGHHPHHEEGETWIESEEMCYKSYDGSGFLRRAYARLPDGALGIVWCAIPDTLSSIPAVRRLKGQRGILGYVTIKDGELHFLAYKYQDQAHADRKKQEAETRSEATKAARRHRGKP